MAISVLKDIRKIYSGLNAAAIREAAQAEVRIGLVATSQASFREMEVFLGASVRHTDRLEAPTKGYDIILCEPGIPVPRNGYLFESANAQGLAQSIVSENPALDLALANEFPIFRRTVATTMINRVSKENALFAAVTALPNVVPSLIELPWTIGEFATDTAFLTMNQIRMAMMMAAAHGRPVGYSEQRKEMAVIAAGAFGWRAMARELVSHIPLGGGIIPKAAVAFAGTYVVGLGLEKLNRTGSGLSRQEKRDAWDDAFAKGKEAVNDLVP